MTVREVVEAGRLTVRGPLGPLRTDDREAVNRAIGRVGLAERAGAPLRTLSGGMQQRAFIARALAAEPALLALDEPTTGVDAASQESLAALLAELRSELGVTILYVSHEFGAVEHVVSRLVLVRGRIAFDGDPADLPALWHDPPTHTPSALSRVVTPETNPGTPSSRAGGTAPPRSGAWRDKEAGREAADRQT
ncbi:MAG: ATP-binding cassette domain-containing protein [Gaiella sp.]|nr:ATP-binding cassette domain-containing protein [Gaiella sp.]